MHTGHTAAGLKRLEAHRKTLLQRLHREQKYIDCLDYLVYQLKQTEKNSRS